MAGSAQYALQRGIVCYICDELIPLEISKTDARGKGVHEECYVRETISRLAHPKAAVHLSKCAASSKEAPWKTVTPRNCGSLLNSSTSKLRFWSQKSWAKQPTQKCLNTRFGRNSLISFANTLLTL